MKKISKPPTFNRMFANRRMKVFVGSLILLVFSSVFYVQCAKEETLEYIGHEKSFSSDDLMRLEFDLESYTTVRPLDLSQEPNLHDFDRLRMNPQFKRDKGYFRVKSDETVYAYLDLAVSPTNEPQVTHQVLQDPNRKKSAYVIIEDNVAKTYDSDGKLLFQHNMDMGFFVGLTTMIQQSKNGFVPSLNDSYIKTADSNDKYDIYEATNPNGDKVVIAIDIQNNRLAYSEMYDTGGKPLVRKIIQYKNNSSGNYPVIDKTIELVYEKSFEQTIDMVRTIVTDFKYFSFNEHI